MLLHFGTNDIEHNDQETVTDDLVEIINLICRRLPLIKDNNISSVTKKGLLQPSCK